MTKRQPLDRGRSAVDAVDGRRLSVDPETVGRDLVCLVLTVVELIRELMERQALRRIDEGDLTDEQIEAIGVTLMALEERMAELRNHFELTPEDLNIDLGPLGPLLAPEG
ncbi:gas vesicle protein K [Catenulispora subtropica]|uniref:Gas vesicle K n=1 Tax=Catenulispora subtropica TaxID=450798 RepID=A0ABN2RMI1_9ACTN